MKQNARMQLIVAAVLFVGWLGWLAYLAVFAQHPDILSRPQFLAADLNVVAAVTGDAQANEHVTIKEVISNLDPKDKLAEGDEIEVLGLTEFGPAQGWHGPGNYLIPLRKYGPKYVVANNPDMPANHPKVVRIYPDTLQVKLQLQKILGKRPD